MSVVDSTELTKRAQQPLAAVAVPLHPLLLVLWAREDLKHQERTRGVKEQPLLGDARRTNLGPEVVGGQDVLVLRSRSPPGMVKFKTLVAEV